MNIFSTQKINLPDLSFLMKDKPVIPPIPQETLLTAKRGYEFMLDFLKNNPNRALYGINTGFGSLCQIPIDEKHLEQLQANLLRSHACGGGNILEDSLIRLMLALKIRALGLGHSGIHPETLLRLHLFLSNDWLPVVYEYGSLGASGDLAPLAHLSLPLIGEGNIKASGTVLPTIHILKEKKITPLRLRPKEGLALLNGTQFMLAHLVWCCLNGYQIFHAANHIAALSSIAFDIKLEPFLPSLHRLRPHPGQSETSLFFHQIFKDFPPMHLPKPQVQDPYSFRCIPQVHGASKDTLDYAAKVCETEINSVTDNPTLLPDENLIVSGGNFHGQPLALALDFLALAIHEMGNISERRIYLLLSGQRGLSPFLAENPGLESGYMIVQYSAASLVNFNKTLCTPSSADSIPSSNGQEDHVSMGANAALKTKKITENVFLILAMELLIATRALKQKNIHSLPEKLNLFFNTFNKHIPYEKNDHPPQPYIQKTAQFIRDYTF